MPLGKLEMTIVRQGDIKYNKDLYYPIIEFRMGKQRVAVNDEKTDLKKNNWQQKTLEFDTST